MGEKRSPEYSSVIRKAFLPGYFCQVAHQQKNGNYLVLRDGQSVALHPSVTIDKHHQFVVYHEFILTSKNFIRVVCGIRPEWLFQMTNGFFKVDDVRNADTKKELQSIERE